MRLVCHLRELRGRRSIRDLSEATGINRGVLSMIENGTHLPKDDQLAAITAAYGAPPEEWYEWRQWYTGVPLLAIQEDPRTASPTIRDLTPKLNQDSPPISRADAQ